jgi:hypothetical protein
VIKVRSREVGGLVSGFLPVFGGAYHGLPGPANHGQKAGPSPTEMEQNSEWARLASLFLTLLDSIGIYRESLSFLTHTRRALSLWLKSVGMPNTFVLRR